MYLLGDAWYKFMPKPVETIAATIMKPSTKPSWRYISPGTLVTSGIYSQNDLEEFKDHIMFPAERLLLLNMVARSSSVHRKIAISTWQKFWSKFLIFGNINVELLGIYLIVRVVKLLLDIFVHGYVLHTVYVLHTDGQCTYLGAIWDSLTQLLLHLGKKKPKTVNARASNSDTHKSKEVNFPKSRIRRK